MQLDLVSGEVDAAGGALLRLVGAHGDVWVQVLTLARVTTAVGTIDAHQVTHQQVGLGEKKFSSGVKTITE